MRNLCQAPSCHNRRRSGAVSGVAPACFLALTLLAALAAGCQADRKSSDRGPADSQPLAAADGPPAATPGLTQAVPAQGARVSASVVGRLDTSAADAFFQLAKRLERGGKVSAEDFGALMARPPYAALRASGGDLLLNPAVLENVMRHVYGGPEAAAAGRGGRGAAPKRRDLVESFQYLQEHASEVAAVLDSCRAIDLPAQVLARVEGWLPRGDLPDTLTISILCAGPDARFAGGRLLVDAGLAAAAGTRQLAQILAAQLYRRLSPPAGPAPKDAGTGKSALAATIARLRHEAIAGWLEDYPRLRFAAAHPALGAADQTRLDALSLAQRSLVSANELLAALRTDRDALDRQGAVVDDLLRLHRAYTATGYHMASTIAARMGEARLREVSLADADFIAAYQEAAGPPGAGGDQAADMPPLADETAAWLVGLLRARER